MILRHERVELRTPKELLAAIESPHVLVNRELWRELQMYTVGIYRNQVPKLSRFLRQVRLPNGEELELYEWMGTYDYRLGISLEDDYERFVL